MENQQEIDEERRRRRTEENREEDEFKQFDIINTDNNIINITNHHYAALSSNNQSSCSKFPTTKIMQEWKILQKNLPDSIFVRAFEGRIDILRAVIIGAQGTPYHDGLFLFDIQFPSNYPNEPPKVYYHSFGFRLNPNLYANGFVCLSLLNTWAGKKNEKWDPSKSTILQVLVSIQALVLNSKPYYNEPYNGIMPNWSYWEKKSLAYNEETFILNCKTILSILNRPPKHFQQLVSRHFRDRAQFILIACKAYIDGKSKVGDLILIENNGSSSSSGTGSVSAGGRSSKKFQVSMNVIYPRLVQAFIKNGSSSLENFVHPPPPPPPPKKKEEDKEEEGDDKCEKMMKTEDEVINSSSSSRKEGGLLKKAYNKVKKILKKIRNNINTVNKHDD